MPKDGIHRSTREAMETLRRAHPRLEELCAPALVRAVTEEEYAVLQTYLRHQTDAAIGFLRRAGVP
ncbi:MAG: hypothetical protein HFF17_08365 [Oscillospiraceae bacterium]|nr:hypothetical protein [Oscillospiraceae bacterium]